MIEEFPEAPPATKRQSAMTKYNKSGMSTTLNCLGKLWAALSLIAAVLCCSGFYLPYWIKGRLPGDVDTYLGSFRRCNYPKITPENTIEIVQQCARYTRWWDIPSEWWRISTLLVGIASGLSLLIAVTAVSAACVPDVIHNVTARISGAVQLIAALLVCGGCAIYPMGWDTREVKDACGPSSPYKLGSCQVWWSAHLLGAAFLLLLVCFIFTLFASKLTNPSVLTL